MASIFLFILAISESFSFLKVCISIILWSSSAWSSMIAHLLYALSLCTELIPGLMLPVRSLANNKLERLLFLSLVGSIGSPDFLATVESRSNNLDSSCRNSLNIWNNHNGRFNTFPLLTTQRSGHDMCCLFNRRLTLPIYLFSATSEWQTLCEPACFTIPAIEPNRIQIL